MALPLKGLELQMHMDHITNPGSFSKSDYGQQS